jgi:hypothetical protein
MQCYADILNEFGANGGFENILTVLKEMSTGELLMKIGHLMAIQSFL